MFEKIWSQNLRGKTRQKCKAPANYLAGRITHHALRPPLEETPQKLTRGQSYSSNSKKLTYTIYKFDFKTLPPKQNSWKRINVPFTEKQSQKATIELKCRAEPVAYSSRTERFAPGRRKQAIECERE
jgi:hypothetical protein